MRPELARGIRAALVTASAVACVVLAAEARAAARDQLPNPDATALHVKLRLVSEASAIAPGDHAWLGLDFALDPGWHIYWVNAGDSGEPPRVAWMAPPGYEVGPLVWPRPSRIFDSPTVVDYGYQGHVLLMAPLRAAATVRPGASATIGVEANWLICRDLCVPGRARLSRPLPVAQRTALDETQHVAFETARRGLPRPMPKTWTASATSAGDSFVIALDTGHAQHTATFLPLQALQVDNAAPQKAESTTRGIRLTVKKADGMQTTPARLSGVLVLDSESSYLVDLPVAATPRMTPR